MKRGMFLAVVSVATIAVTGQAAPPISNDPLFMATLPIEIQNAEYASLTMWLRQLGLDDTGEPAEIRQRLRDFYGLPLPKEQLKKNFDSDITVHSAQSAIYRTDEHGHTIVELVGDVSIAAHERDSGILHLIRADRINYNGGIQSLTATGSVVYSMVSSDGSEVFQGKRLSVDTEFWEGIFYAGSGRNEQKVGGKEIVFSYSGEVITRRKDDTMVIEDATITSSTNSEDPSYRIEADRVWILSPREWAVRDAFLYVGEVPILYLPYFLRPGGRIFFHPALGQRRREGTYLQPTTYLVGRKSLSVTSPSFLQEREGSFKHALERSGLFVRPTGDTVNQDLEPEENDLLTLMVDLYSRLGIFGGLKGNMGDLSFFTGVGASRSLIKDLRLGGNYTPYLRGEDGKLISHWDTSRIFGVAVPLRYGLEIEIDRRGDFGTVQGHFELFSDPSFTSDFLARTDVLASDGFLGWSRGPIVPPPPRDRLEWQLGGNLMLNQLIDSPVLDTFTIPALTARWWWRSREEEYSGDLTGTALERLQSASPTRWFYYPDTLTLPAVAVVADGSLFRWSTDDGEVDARFGYSIRPVIAIDHHFANDQVTTRDQVTIDTKFSRIDARVTGQLTYSASAFDQLIGINGSLTEAAAVQIHAAQAEDIGSGLSEQLSMSDRSRTRSNLRIDNTLTLRPLLSEDQLAESRLSYGLGLTLYDLTFDSVTGDAIESTLGWNLQGIPTHRLDTGVRFSNNRLSMQIDAGVDLPPRPLSVAGRFDVVSDPFRLTLRGGIDSKENSSRGSHVVPTAIDGRGTLLLNKDISLAQSFRLDSDQKMESFRTEARAYGVSGAMQAGRRVQLDPFGKPLSADDDPTFRVTDLTLDYGLDSKTLSYWKDRMNLNLGLHARLEVDPEAYVNDNSLVFDFQLGLSVHELIDLAFSSSSVNRHLHRYFPAAAKRAGESWVNPIIDLARSFNFLNNFDRMASAFKLDSLRVEALHRLGDWDLSLAYQGRPEQRSNCPGQEQIGPCIAWTPAFSVEVRWIPIPELHGSGGGDRWGLDIEDR